MNANLPQIIRNDEEMYEGDLVHYFKVIFSFARNLFNPYHNFRHIFHVLWLCYDAIMFYADELTLRERRNVLIAALFHDFDHSGRVGQDDLEIERAVRGLRKHIAPKDVPFLGDIEAIVRATQFPHTTQSEKLPLSEQIIRDADMGQTLDPVWIQQIVFGLAEETATTPRTMLEAQEPFLSKLSFATEWGRRRFNGGLVEAKIQEARDLLLFLR